MKTNRRPLLLLCCFLFLPLAGCAVAPPAAQYFDTADLAAVRDDVLALARRHGAGQVLAVFDLDNTLLAMEQGLGSDQWYEWQKSLAADAPCGPGTVPDRLAVQGALYFASAMRPTQGNAPTIVADLQAAGVRTVALTSRGPDFRLQTFRELRRNGYDFRRAALPPAAGWADDFPPDRGTRAVRYEDGVFLTAGQHKGEMLLELLERTGLALPRAIVMADDKRANLDAVVETFDRLGVPVRAWRYAGEDETVRAFDPAAAQELWNEIRPALATLEAALGPDHYRLPRESSPACADGQATKVRFATLNAAMGLPEEGELRRRLVAGDDPKLAALAEVLQRTRPDVVLLTEMDYWRGSDAAELLQRNYLAQSQGGQEPIAYAHHYSAPVNTGVPSGLDVNANGTLEEPADGWGFGRFPGQYGMLLLSRFPLDEAAVRSFRLFKWSDLPGALRPEHPGGRPFHDDDTWHRLRLSSKSHWDVPLRVGKTTVHLLASHPTPPGFDGPEDLNGRRNHDEIRLWADYLRPAEAGYLVDDRGQAGGLHPSAAFVIAGDLNSDPNDGGSRLAIRQLLEHERVGSSCTPRAPGGAEAAREQGGVNEEHRSDPAEDTADFSDSRVGNLRADYVLPSSNLEVVDCGVFWPARGEPGFEASGFSDHRLVWVDLSLPSPE